jgi:hypothetical protein
LDSTPGDLAYWIDYRLTMLFYLIGNLDVTLGANLPLIKELAVFAVAHALPTQRGQLLSQCDTAVQAVMVRLS